MALIYPLKNQILPYAWGSTTAIATLLGHSTPSETPQAELWMGGHPKAPSLIQIDEKWISLIDGIGKDPESMLGAHVARRFERRLPYLFKVLAVAKPLSIQAHPNIDQAKIGFAREEAQNIPFDAPHRNYRDANHKPECICALTPFWALNGFRPIDEVLQRLQTACPQTLSAKIKPFIDTHNQSDLKPIFELLMTFSPERKAAVVGEAVAFAQTRKTTAPTWEWMVRLARFYPNDIGILSPLFLNLVCLSPGEAMYLPAGRIHAYLEGTGLELMANSDNVLRGGLTGKYMDVIELLNVLDFDSETIKPIKPQRLDPCEEKYPVPAVEFSLIRITLDGTRSHKGASKGGPRILLCIDGSMEIKDIRTGETVGIEKGHSVFVAGSIVDYELTGKGICFAATVPL